MKKRYRPHEIKPLLQALSATNGIIIGGQAINLWAERYHRDAPPWTELSPYTSFDLDVLGSRADVLKCGRVLDVEPFFPPPSENTVNSGKIVARIGQRDFEIDFLHSPNGLSPAEVVELARPVVFESVTIRVLHPLHCLESKTVNLATLPQDAGDRQDLKHLRLAVAIFREHLAQLTTDGTSEELLLRWARRVRANANHELGLRAASQHGINFRDAIPADCWLAKGGRLGGFMQSEWIAWQTEIGEKMTDLQELDAWLKSLNQGKPLPRRSE